jgi:hypothetical protein
MAISFSLSSSFFFLDLGNTFTVHDYGRQVILAIIFLVMNTKTPCTTDSMMYGWNWIIAYRNSFTKGQMGLNRLFEQTKNSHMFFPLHIFLGYPPLKLIHFDKYNFTFTEKGHNHLFPFSFLPFYSRCKLITFWFWV